MRMTSSSLTRVVPPVTLLRMSVPGSLSTGADSPVMADSLTKPTPSMTSPSPGIDLALAGPPRCRPGGARRSRPPRACRRPASECRGHGAGLAQRGRLGPTARLGDRLGVRREQHREPQPDGDLELEAEAPGPVGWRPRMSPTSTSVTRAAVISTTNMTGLRISSRGSSLRTASGMAARSSSGSRMPRGPRRRRRRGHRRDAPPPKRWKRRVPRDRSSERRMVIGDLRRSSRPPGAAAPRSVRGRVRGSR